MKSVPAGASSAKAYLPLPALAVALTCATLPAPAQTPQSGQYRVAAFTAAQGIPSQAITDLAETSDGYLWIAAGGILARFDGYIFQTYTARTIPLLSRRINSVHAGLGDTLWIVDDGGAVLSFADGRVAEVVPPFSAPIASVMQSGRGLLFAVGADSAWPLRGQSQRATGEPLLTRDDLRPEFIFWADSQGTSWLSSKSYSLVRVADGTRAPAGSAPPTLVFSPSRREVYEVRARGPLREVVDAYGRVYAAYRYSPRSEARLIDSRGQLWVTTPAATSIYAPGNPEPAHVLSQLAYGQVQRVLEDRSGCVWTARFALHRACLVPFTTIARDTALSERAATSATRGPSGSALILDASGTLTQATPSGYRVLERGVPGELRIDAAWADRRETIWLSRGNRVIGRVRDGTEIQFPSEHVHRYAGHPGRDDVIWFAGYRHIYRATPYAPAGPRITDSVPHGGTEVTALSVTSGEVVWAALKMPDQSARLLRIEKGKTTPFTPRDGLPSSALRAVLAEDDGTVWIGTYGEGLVRFRNGRFQEVSENDGLAEDVVTSILRDDAGNFWMGGNRSIHRLSRAQLEAFLDGRETRVYGTSYGVSDGIDDPETSGWSGVRDDRGRLWFPTLGGAAVVDPALAVALDSQPPLVHILGIGTETDSIATDNWSARPTGPLRLTLGSRRLEISFTGIALRNPAGLRYEYRIDGVDNRWITARGRTAVYNHVPPGTHAFRVRAIGPGGIPHASEVRLQFIVPAHAYETPAFFVLMAVALGALGWLGIDYRVRSLRRREAELTRQVEARTQKLAVALQTVAQQADELRALDEAKSRFFANVSHEFRTPLSLILGPVEDLRDGRAGPMSPQARRRLDNVVSNARRLVQLVEQLLDVARLESGKLHLSAEAQDLIPLVRRMADSFASLAEHRGIAFQLSCTVGAVRVRYDNDHMQKIIGNLLGNALKFTPAGGVVQFRVSSEFAHDGVAIIEVEDSGPGIAPEHQERVFERFYQVDDSERRAHGGVGIGLALVKELVELHGGTISLRSAAGEGCTFTVRLPLAPGASRHSGDWKVPPEPAAVALAPAEERDAAAVRAAQARHATQDIVTVLVVEDNADLLDFLGEHLAERFRVLKAPNGARGLEMAREHVPDLIISDVMMPEMDGQAMCEAVKSDPEIDFVPVILLTAKASRDSRLAGLSGGADDYLTKPVDLTELMIRAENLIASRRRVRERYRAEQKDLPSMEVSFKPAARDASSRALLERLYALMSDNLADEAFDVERMAAAMGMGRTTLYRKLEALLGKSPMEALWEYRLAQAAQWLAETSITVSEVAYGVGFKSVPHFCTKFRERHGETPSGYRRARQGDAASV